MNVIDRFPAEGPRERFLEAIRAHDPVLLDELRAVEEPTAEQRERVGDALSDGFEWEGPDYRPMARTIRLEQLIDAFFTMWPLRRVRAAETAPDAEPGPSDRD